MHIWGPPSLLYNVYEGALSLGVERPVREADHSPPPSVVVKNACYTSTPQYIFLAWCSVKAQGQLYLYLLKQQWKDVVQL